eukprot:IDg14136t1
MTEITPTCRLDAQHPAVPQSVDTQYCRQGKYYPNDSLSTEVGPKSNSKPISRNYLKPFDACDLKKLHLQLKHGSKTQMIEWIKSADRWSSHLQQGIAKLLQECDCTLANPPSPHNTVSDRPPMSQKQSDLNLDTIFLEGVPCIHVICKATRWSETAALPSNRLRDQIAAFKRIQIFRHGAPKRIHADNQYNKDEFLRLCNEIGAEFISSAANDHESNGAIESANRILRTYFRRLRAVDAKSSVRELLAEATYGKNINKGQKLATSFELLYEHKPRILDEHASNQTPVSVEQQNSHTARQRIHKMMRTNVRTPMNLKRGEYVYFWRDGHRWIGPARVTQVVDGIVTMIHDGRHKTSSINRVQRTATPTNEPESEDEPSMDTTISEETLSGDKSNSSESDGENSPIGKPGAPWIPRYRNTVLDSAQIDLSQGPAEELDHSTYMSNTANPTTSKLFYSTLWVLWTILKGFQKQSSSSQTVKRLLHTCHSELTGSHVVYRRKPDGSCKARIVPWGHRDSEKHELRKDAPCMNAEMMRILFSIAVEKEWQIGQMDVRAALLQAKGFDRMVFVRPPREEGNQNQLWRLTAAA